MVTLNVLLINLLTSGVMIKQRLLHENEIAIFSKLEILRSFDQDHFGQSFRSSTRHLKIFYECLHCKLFLTAKLL